MSLVAAEAVGHFIAYSKAKPKASLCLSGSVSGLGCIDTSMQQALFMGFRV